MAVEAKICGIRTREALDAALDGGADYIGLVFYPKSPRNVDIATAKTLADVARGRARVVALLVNASDEQIEEIIAGVEPDILQLHGSETFKRVAEIASTSGLPLMKAVAVSSAADAACARDYLPYVDRILFDAKPPECAGSLPGGNGEAFDWSLLKGVRGQFAYILSGGLNPANVVDAIRATGTSAVDVSSGVERAPGEKDAELIRRFLAAVKSYKA
jgi:phosphoribosylanthranilate isomerase